MPKNKPKTFPVGAAFIEFLHDEVVSEIWPQTDPIAPGEYRDNRLLESAAARPFQSAFGQDAYPDVTEKAAALFHSLVANHCFHNGNKRTAVLAVACFLLANGFFLALDADATYSLATAVASYRERGKTHAEVLEEIIAVLRPNAIALEDLKKDPDSRALFQKLVKSQRSLRRHALNR